MLISNFILGFGFLVAMFGWVLNIPIVYLLYRFLHTKYTKKIALKAAITLWSLVLSIDYFYGYIHYKMICNQYASQTAPLEKIVGVKHWFREGVNRNGPFLELGRHKTYLASGELAFIESENTYYSSSKIQTQTPYVKYTLDNNHTLQATPINTPLSTYGYRLSIKNRHHVYISTYDIYHRESEKLYNRIYKIRYQGGYLWWFTSPFGIVSCSNQPKKYFILNLDLWTFMPHYTSTYYTPKE